MKTIFLLIGAKGSGKSFIGTLIQENFDIPFLRVEDWAKQVKRERAVTDESYLNEVFNAIENGVRDSLEKNDNVVFESTGLTDQFDKMFESLNKDFSIIKIGVIAEPDLCLQRAKIRDQSIHINVSDDQINMINSAFAKKNTATDYQIENNNKSADELIAEIKKIIDRA